MYTREPMPATPRRALPEALPSVLSTALAAGCVLAVATRCWEAAGSAGAFVAAWAIAAAFGLAATLRRRLPAWRARGAGWIWLAAAAAGGAVMARHALDALTDAGGALPLSVDVAPGLDVGELGVAVAVVAAVLPAVWAGALRRRRPRLMVVGLLAVAGPAVTLLAARHLPVLRGLDAPSGDAVRHALTLAWTAALVGPASLPLRSRDSLTDRALPRLAQTTALVAGTWLLAGSPPRSGAALAGAGARAFGPYGDHVGAGLECAAALCCAAIVVVLGTRIAARRLADLRSRALLGVALAAAVLMAALPMTTLLALAGALGWAAVVVGPEEAPWAPAGAAVLDGREVVTDEEGGA